MGLSLFIPIDIQTSPEVWYDWTPKNIQTRGMTGCLGYFDVGICKVCLIFYCQFAGFGGFQYQVLLGALGCFLSFIHWHLGRMQL